MFKIGDKVLRKDFDEQRQEEWIIVGMSGDTKYNNQFFLCEKEGATITPEWVRLEYLTKVDVDVRIFSYKWTDGNGYITNCPFSGVKIGSVVGRDCKYFVAKNDYTKIVCCDCPNELVCPHCGTKYDTIEKLENCIVCCTCEHDWGNQKSRFNYSDKSTELGRTCQLCGKQEKAKLSVNDMQDIFESV